MVGRNSNNLILIAIFQRYSPKLYDFYAALLEIAAKSINLDENHKCYS